MTRVLSPFSAALTEEMALQPKGTVLGWRAISSDCLCSETQLHQFIINAELFGTKTTGLPFIFWLCIVFCVCVFFFFIQDDPFTYRQLSTRLYLSHLETESQEDIQEETEVSQDADRGDILCHLFSKRLAPHSLLPEPSRDNIKQRKDRSEACGCRRQVRVEIKHLQLLSGWIESYRAKQ